MGKHYMKVVCKKMLKDYECAPPQQAPIYSRPMVISEYGYMQRIRRSIHFNKEHDYNSIHKDSFDVICTQFKGPLALSPDDLRYFKQTKFDQKIPKSKVVPFWEILPLDIIGIINEFHKIPHIREFATGFDLILNSKEKAKKFKKYGDTPYKPNVYFISQPKIVNIPFPYGGNVFITLNTAPLNNSDLCFTMNELVMHLKICAEINCISNCGTVGNQKFLILSIIGYGDHVGAYSCINMFDTNYLFFFQPVVGKKSLSFFINEYYFEP